MSLSVFELAERFFAFMQARNAPGTVAYYRRHIDRFLAHVGNVRAGELRKHHLLTFARTWHALQSVQRLFSWAHADAELIDRNPFKGIRRPRPGMRRRTLTAREMARLLRAAAPEFRGVLVALRESICRPQEVRTLSWECIRWEGDQAGALQAIAAGCAWFELWEYKSRTQRADPNTPRLIFINARFGRLLLRLARRSPSLAGVIFRNVKGDAWTSNAIRLRMIRLCKRCKVQPDTRGEKVVAYTFRHTAATTATANGVQDRVLAELMGHTTTRTTARYQHLNRSHLRNAVNRVNTRRTGNTK